MGDAVPYIGRVRRQRLKENRLRMAFVALRFVLGVLRRSAQCFVIGPSVIAGVAWTLAVALGMTNTHEVVQNFYTYADASIRGAPAGMVRVETCIERLPAPAPGLVPQANEYSTLDCKTTRMIDVPVAQVVAETVAEYTLFYWVSVGLSAFYLFAFYTMQHAEDIARRVRHWIARARVVLGGRKGFPPL